jgi:hypothetical protein
MFPYVQNEFKVVEINNVVALRSGHIISQVPLYRAADTNYPLATEVVQNGYILYLDLDGELKAPGDADELIVQSQNPILHYTEELFTGPLTTLEQFAVPFVDGTNYAYPRGLVLNIGDTFTTNNYAGSFSASATLAEVNNAGQFVPKANKAALTNGYHGPLFSIVDTTLPDGETPAYEFTYLGIVNNVAE